MPLKWLVPQNRKTMRIIDTQVKYYFKFSVLSFNALESWGKWSAINFFTLLNVDNDPY